jgi:hypothetical protein
MRLEQRTGTWSSIHLDRTWRQNQARKPGESRQGGKGKDRLFLVKGNKGWERRQECVSLGRLNGIGRHLPCGGNQAHVKDLGSTLVGGRLLSNISLTWDAVKGMGDKLARWILDRGRRWSDLVSPKQHIVLVAVL